jgi:hypothetical protein
MEKIILKRLDKVYCRIGVSSTHGVGIIAVRDIPKGTNPFADSYIGQDSVLINKKKVSNENIKKMLEDYFPTNENPDFIIPSYPNQIIWTNYLNYTSSEKANIILDDYGKWTTITDIKAGEELLEDPSHHFNSDGSFKSRTLNKNKNDYLNLRI